MTNNNDNWKFQNYVRGSMLGLAVGVMAAYLYNRATEENLIVSGGERTSIGASDMIKVSLSILALVRQVTELGASSNTGNQGKSSSR